MKRRRRLSKKTHFVLGRDLRDDGHARVTRGPQYVVEGGTEASHGETVDIVEAFSKKLEKERPADAGAVQEILHDVLKKKGYRQAPKPDPKAN